MNKSALLKPMRLPDGAPLEFAPENEQGVVFLFSHLAKKFGVHVEKVQKNYPDCIATKDGKRIRIEFEFRSRNFHQHRHSAKACDWIVCWIHDWPSVPDNLRVIELRKEYNLGFNVWFQPVKDTYSSQLKKINFDSSWSVASQAAVGNLILFYHSNPDKYICDIFKVSKPVKYVKAGWKKGKDWMAEIRRVCTLRSPIHLSQLQRHRVIRDAGFVRGKMQGRYRATPYWPDLYDLIIATNPSLAYALRNFEPSRVL